MFPKETSEITLARLVGEGRGEGAARIIPLPPCPLPPRRRGGEGKILVGVEPTTVEITRLLSDGCLMPTQAAEVFCACLRLLTSSAVQLADETRCLNLLNEAQVDKFFRIDLGRLGPTSGHVVEISFYAFG